MVKLTEIYCTKSYQEQLGSKILEEYTLREVCVNPKYVALFREDEVLSKKHQTNKLRDDLHKEISFTKLIFSSKHSFTVVGNLDIIMGKLNYKE